MRKRESEIMLSLLLTQTLEIFTATLLPTFRESLKARPKAKSRRKIFATHQAHKNARTFDFFREFIKRQYCMVKVYKEIRKELEKYDKKLKLALMAWLIKKK